MDMIVPKHERSGSADANSIIVTLFRGAEGLVRGWYIGPPSFDPRVPMAWQTSPDDNLFGSIALVQAMEVARKLELRLSVVDPDDLWTSLHGYVALRPAGKSASSRVDH